MNAARAILRPLCCIDTSFLRSYPRREELVGAAALIGCFDAAWHGYTAIMPDLADAAATAPLPYAKPLAQMVRVSALAAHGGGAQALSGLEALVQGAPAALQQAAAAVRARVQAEVERDAAAELPALVVPGGALPMALTGRVTRTVIAKRALRGPTQQLDDGHSISSADAWMWAAVNPLAPSGSGARIVPK